VKDTLCWHCRNVGKRLCPWDDSKGQEPTPGWDAVKVPWGKAFTYIVRDCPLKDIEEIDPNRGRKEHIKGSVNMERLAELIVANWSIFEIAEELDIDVCTVSEYKRRMKEAGVWE